MHWRDIWTLYRFEIRAALRERAIIVNSILVPILLYPFILWAMFSGITFVAGQAERLVSRVAIIDLPEAHASLLEQLEADEQIELVPPVAAAKAVEQIRSGELDALAEFLPPDEKGAALEDNFRVRLTADRSKERSAKARQRLTELVDRYRTAWLDRSAAEEGLSAAEWQVFTIQRDNLASGEEMGAFLLGLMLPLFFVIMVAVGCFHPAVDATAGERERNTWETTMTLATSRLSIVTAKYLYVTTFGCMAGILNVAAMTLSMRTIVAPLLEEGDGALVFNLPWAALPVLAIGAVLLSGFIAAGMMIFAAFARTFREGQSMITPFYLLIVLPLLLLSSEGVEFTLRLAFTPIINVAMMIREAMLGIFRWPQIAITLGVGLATIALCVWLAAMILRFEDVVIGSYSGNIGRFLRERVLNVKTKPATAVEG